MCVKLKNRKISKSALGRSSEVVEPKKLVPTKSEKKYDEKFIGGFNVKKDGPTHT
jgi:hypothetical protein